MTERDAHKLIGCHPLLQTLFVDVSKRHSIGIAQGARTLEESVHNKETGHSWLKDPGNSEHIPKADGWAHAFDFFVRNSDGTANWELPLYTPVVADFKATAAARGIEIICGLDWKVKDAGHVQLVLPTQKVVP